MKGTASGTRWWRSVDELADGEVRALVESLGEEGRRAYDLMVNDDPDRTRTLIEGLSPRVREYFEALTLAGQIERLRAHLIIGHGRADDLIPYTESLLLADNVPSAASVHLAILESFQHVDLKLGEGEGVGAFFASVAEVGRLFSITYDLLPVEGPGSRAPGSEASDMGRSLLVGRP